MEPQNMILAKPSEVAEKLMCMLDGSALKSNVLLLTVHYPKYPDIEPDLNHIVAAVKSTMLFTDLGSVKGCFIYPIITENEAKSAGYLVILFLPPRNSFSWLTGVMDALDKWWKQYLGLCPKRFDLVNFAGHDNDNKFVFSLKKNDASSRKEFTERINTLLKVDVSSAEATRELYSYFKLSNRKTARSKHLPGS